MNNIISDIYISCVRCAGKNKNYLKKKTKYKTRRGFIICYCQTFPLLFIDESLEVYL